MPVRLEACLLATVVVVAARAQRGWRGEVEEIWRGWMGPLKGARFPLTADAYHARPTWYRTQNVESLVQQGTANIMHDASTLCVTSMEKYRAFQVNTCIALMRYRDATLDCSRVVKYESYVVPIWRLHARLPTSPPRPFFCAAFYHDDDQRTTLAPRTSTY